MKMEQSSIGSVIRRMWEWCKVLGSTTHACGFKSLSQVYSADSIYPHNHEIDPMAVTVSKIKANIKQRSVERVRSHSSCLIMNSSLLLLLWLPVFQSAVRKQVRRIRIRTKFQLLEARRVEDVQFLLQVSSTKVAFEIKNSLARDSGRK
uniref:Uncharacterized protein n=1 Tax=Ditylenchus dipsaci TaxID=166011 RepID=A0A915CZK6_9BILA